MLGDGLVPSNAGAGYLARLMIRRSLRLAEELQMSCELFDLIEMHKNLLGFEFEVPLDTIYEMLELEKERFKASIEKGIKIVERTVGKKKKISKSDLIEFYESHGLPAELVYRIAKEKGVEVEAVDIYSELAKMHSKAEKEKKEQIILKKTYPKTLKLYYENPKLFEFTANVLGFENGYLILDRTAFYPESGGQESDSGYIILNGEKFRVSKVLEIDGIVLHKIEGAGKMEGEVRGIVDSKKTQTHETSFGNTSASIHASKALWKAHMASRCKERSRESQARCDAL